MTPRECKWCGQRSNQRFCSDDCFSSWNGYPVEEPLPEVGLDDIEMDEAPEWTHEDAIHQIGKVIAEEDPVQLIDGFNSKTRPDGVNNGIWWRMNGWREKMPSGYVATACIDCGKPVAKPSAITESVSCEFCTPPEII